jgi:hypothetical protein
MPPKAKPKIKIKVKKLSKKQLENKATACLKDLHKTYTDFQDKFQKIIRDCSKKNPDKETLKTDLFNTVHSISHVLSKAVPLELRNSPNDHSTQIRQLLNNWIKESSAKKASKKSISYTGVVKKFIEASLSPEGKVRFGRTKKNSNSGYRPLDARNILNPTADDTQCDIAFRTDNWPGTHKCYICGLCLHNMQSDKCGAPCEHLLNIYQVMITFGFIETDDKLTFDVEEDCRTCIYAPSCTCCNSEKSNIEIISFKDNIWQVNENNVEMLLDQVQNSKRECCYKDGHPEEPNKNNGKDDKVWAKSINEDKCDDSEDNLIQFQGEKHTRPLHGVVLDKRTTEIVTMLNKRVNVLNRNVPRPRTTKNVSQLNALIQIATFFTHISFNAYKKIAVEMAGRTHGGTPPAAGAGDDSDDSDDSEYELCSDTDADCCDDTDTDCFNIEFKKLFEFYFWKEIEEFITATKTPVTLDYINTLLSSDIFNGGNDLGNGDFTDYQLNIVCYTDNIEYVHDTLITSTKGQAMKIAAEPAAEPTSMKIAAAPAAAEPAAEPTSMKIAAPTAMKIAAAPAAAEPTSMKIAAAPAATYMNDTEYINQLQNDIKILQNDIYEIEISLGPSYKDLFEKILYSENPYTIELTEELPEYAQERDIMLLINLIDRIKGIDFLKGEMFKHINQIKSLVTNPDSSSDDSQPFNSSYDNENSDDSQPFPDTEEVKDSDNSDSQSQPNSENEDEFTQELTSYIQTVVNTPSKRSSSSPHAPVGTESSSKRSNSPRFIFQGLPPDRSSSVNPDNNKEPPRHQRPWSAPTYTTHDGHGDYGGGKKTRKNKTKKQNKTRKQKPKKQTKRISYVKNKQTRKNKKRIKKSNSKKAT